MLTLLYKLLLRFRKQDEVTEDMLATFEEARADARARGWWSYCAFGVRELLGVAGAPGIRGRRWPLIVGWGAMGLAAGLLVTYAVPAQYTSIAALRITPPVISENLYNSGANFDADVALSHLLPIVESRTVMTNIINVFGLYPNTRKRYPIQDVLERMRKDIHIERAGSDSIVVSFTYGDSRQVCSTDGWQEPDTHCDRFTAQRVVQDLVSRLIDENIRRRSNEVFQTERYFADRSEEIAKDWEKLNAEVRGIEPSNPHYERMVLDRDLARKEYESVRQKYRDSQMVSAMEGRKMGRLLELLDPASLPPGPDTSPVAIALAGLGVGLLLGSLFALIRTIRRIPALLLPQVAQS